MPPLAKRLSYVRTACTRLTRTVGVHLNKHTSGTFSLVRDHVHKLCPTSIENTLGKIGSCHPLDVQILSRYQAVSVNQGSAQVVVKIRPLPLDTAISTLKQRYGISSPLRTSLTPRYAPLRHSQGALGFPVIAWVDYFRSIAQGGEVRQANVDPDHAGIERQRLRLNLAGEQRKPVANLALDGQRLNLACQWAMQFNSHLPDLRQSETIPFQSVPNVPKRQTVIALCRTKARESRLLARPNTAEEGFKRKVYPLQSIFQRSSRNTGNVRAIWLDVLQLQCLVKVGDRLPLKSPCVAPFLKRGIVKFRADRKVFIKGVSFALGRIDSILESL